VVVVRPECARAVFYADCTDADAAWAISRLQPEPLRPPGAAAITEPADRSARDRVPRVYVECLQDRALGPATQRRMYTALPCRRVYSLPTGHSPFLSAPADLAACLLDVAVRFDRPASGR